MLFKLMFRVSQSKMLSLNISVTAPFFGGDAATLERFLKSMHHKEINVDMREKCAVLFGKGTATQSSRWPNARHLEMCSWISNLRSQFQSVARNKCVPVGVRICQISNYASDGGSRHREGDKYNLHVFLTSGKTERLSTVLPCKLLTSEDMMQSNHLHLRKTIKIQSRFKQVWEKRIEGTGDERNKEKIVVAAWYILSEPENKQIIPHKVLQIIALHYIHLAGTFV